MKHIGTIGLGLLACGALVPRAWAQDGGLSQPEPLACDAELSCPPPLACDAEADGGPVCTWQVIECTDASACPTRFECVEASRYGECIECTADEGGNETCKPAPCEGPSTCEPEKIDCTSDADCPTDWGCVTLLDYPVPAYWQVADGDVGCVPDGAIALGEGRVAFTTLESAAGSDILEASATSGPAEADPGAPGATADGADADDMSAAMPGGAKASMPGNECAATAPGARRSATGASLVLLALAWLTRRRSRVAR